MNKKYHLSIRYAERTQKIEDSEKILIFATGGTIDKEYSSDAGTRDLSIGKPRASKILLQAKVLRESGKINQFKGFKIKSLLTKDSLDMDDKDRLKIAKVCANTSARRIVITHGTDTMTKTALFIDAYFKERGIKKTVVITGANQPWEMKESDADFNLALSIEATRRASSGVYIAMNGHVYHYTQCKKNTEKNGKGVFEPIVFPLQPPITQRDCGSIKKYRVDRRKSRS